MFERRCDLGDKGGLALSIKIGSKKGLVNLDLMWGLLMKGEIC